MTRPRILDLYCGAGLVAEGRREGLTGAELSQGIPPIYAEHVGRALMKTWHVAMAA